MTEGVQVNSPEIASLLQGLLTAEEVAALLRVTRKWVYDHAEGRRQPKLPHFEISNGGRKLRRFSRKQIEDFLEDCQKWANR